MLGPILAELPAIEVLDDAVELVVDVSLTVRFEVSVKRLAHKVVLLPQFLEFPVLRVQRSGDDQAEGDLGVRVHYQNLSGWCLLTIAHVKYAEKRETCVGLSFVYYSRFLTL